MPKPARVALATVACVILAVTPPSVQARAATSTPDGRRLLHKMQDALGGASRIAGIHDYEETLRAQAWDGRGGALGEVVKRTRWIRTPDTLRLDQRGPRGTYVLYFDGDSGSGWEILPERSGPDPFKTTGKAVRLAGAELHFAQAYLSGFELNLWLADRLPGYQVTSPGPNILRIEHGGDATDFRLDPASGLPVASTYQSLADPNHPAPAEMRYEGWKNVSGVLFAVHRVSHISGLKRGEVFTDAIHVNAGLRAASLEAEPANGAPEIPHSGLR